MNWMRRIASWTLLVAYMPLVVLSSLHVHHETVDMHDDCMQCVGHIEEQHNHQCDCQYCHVLSQSYLGQADGQTVVLLPVTERLTLMACEPAVQLHYGVSLLRAPPATMC